MNELIPRIYDAGCGQAGWDEVMTQACAYLGAAGHLTYRVAKDPEAGSSTVLSNDRFSDELLQRYFSHYSGCNIWAASDAMVPGAVFTSSQLYPDERLKQTEYWSGWLRHADVFYVVGGIIHDDAQSRTKVSFVRPEGAGRFEERERRLLESVAPHFQQALGAQQRLAQASLLVQTLDEVDQGVVLLESDGRLVHMNACAGALLASQRSLRIVRRRLEFVSAEHADQFRALARTDVQLARTRTLHLRLEGDTGQVLHAALLRLPDGDAGSRRLALFIRPQRRGAAPELALRHLYGLSPAEASLASSLADGLSVAELAETRGVSLHTIRAQLKAVLHKLGVRRQAEVVQIVGSLVQRHDAGH
ncbi:LuxR C-terminal-related transcriptional regulator [Ramlibacter sp.]|uniref:helix-turn-helix transcriptional regulator n=1 Tax=Ramlibacter sp. TaxID=1917967 RepID=UPI002D4A85ED|nr:LuxR C-terminal-related transcriptional regulator [Ramlibacter sp.]HYD76087.1 LuxR C-terminal-related transcriptional regulator [Ramlibacter sp.]